MKEKREGGSMPGFIIGAIILIGLLVGGAYFVQQQSRNKPSTTPAPIELPGGDQKPAEEPTPPPAVAVPQPPSNNSTTQPSSPTNRLPQSGPADGFVAVLVIGLLVGVGVSYVQSRRQLAPL